MPSQRKSTKCACGCQQMTPLATKTDKRRGQVKGEPMRFMPGHNSASTKKVSNVGLMAPEEIGQMQLFALRDKPDAEVAKKLDARVRDLERQHKRSFVEVGLICNEMSDRSLWKELVDPETGNYFQSFDRWLMDAAQVSRSGAYAAMKALKDITDVPIAELQEMPRCNVITLGKLSPKVRKDPKVIEAAKTQTEDEFLKTLEDQHPQQHIESTRKMELKPTKSGRKVIDLAIAAVMWAEEAKTREEAMEFLSNFYLDARCAIEGYGEMSNQFAYETAKIRGEIPLVNGHAEAHAHPVA